MRWYLAKITWLSRSQMTRLISGLWPGFNLARDRLDRLILLQGSAEKPLYGNTLIPSRICAFMGVLREVLPFPTLRGSDHRGASGSVKSWQEMLKSRGAMIAGPAPGCLCRGRVQPVPLIA